VAQKETIVVEGLAPLLRDFNRLSKTATKQLREAIRPIAAPVALDVKFRESDTGALGKTGGKTHSFGARTVSGVKVIVRQRGVSVEQTRKKTADVQRRRGNFGDLQMKRAFLPALADNAAAIERRTAEFLDAMIEGRVL
jgi:hypothetical protein